MTDETPIAPDFPAGSEVPADAPDTDAIPGHHEMSPPEAEVGEGVDGFEGWGASDAVGSDDHRFGAVDTSVRRDETAGPAEAIDATTVSPEMEAAVTKHRETTSPDELFDQPYPVTVAAGGQLRVSLDDMTDDEKRALFDELLDTNGIVFTAPMPRPEAAVRCELLELVRRKRQGLPGGDFDTWLRAAVIDAQNDARA